MQEPEAGAEGQSRRIERQIARFLGQPLPQAILDALPPSPVVIVDVGALELEGVPDLYDALFRGYPCRVVGFEPQAGQTDPVLDGVSDRLVLPLAVGTGDITTFHRTRYPACSSTLRPDAEFLDMFRALPDMLAVEQVSEITTVRLDDIAQATGCDLLKLDVQGGELAVLQGARRLLAEVGVVIAEVEFSPLYKGQPLFADVDSFLRSQGFDFIDFLDRGWGAYKAGLVASLNSRLLWADAAYVKTVDGLRDMEDAKLLKAFLACHMVLRNPGQAAFILQIYDQRHGTTLNGYYLNALLASPWC